MVKIGFALAKGLRAQFSSPNNGGSLPSVILVRRDLTLLFLTSEMVHICFTHINIWD